VCRRYCYMPMPTLRRCAMRSIGTRLLRRSRRADAAEFLELNLDTTEPKESTLATELLIPADLIVAAWRSLFPAERMMLLGGSRSGEMTRVSSSWDVTGLDRSVVHVKASSTLLGRTLLDFEASGVHMLAWLHSHPGRSSMATHPSQIDWRQDADFRRDFGSRVVGFIVTEDGYLRAWGRALDEGSIKLTFEGSSVESIPGEAHVYRLAVR